MYKRLIFIALVVLACSQSPKEGLERPIIKDGWYTMSAKSMHINVVHKGDSVLLDGGEYGASEISAEDLQLIGDTIKIRANAVLKPVRNGTISIDGRTATSLGNNLRSKDNNKCPCSCTQCVFTTFTEVCCGCGNASLGFCFLAWGCQGCGNTYNSHDMTQKSCSKNQSQKISHSLRN